MPVVKYAKGTVELDDEGYLVRLDDWNEEVACVLAEREAVEELTEDRMEIIKFLRNYYKQFNHFPVLSGVCRNVHQEKECILVRSIGSTRLIALLASIVRAMRAFVSGCLRADAGH